MNIETAKINKSTNNQKQQTNITEQEASVKFSDELMELEEIIKPEEKQVLGDEQKTQEKPKTEQIIIGDNSQVGISQAELNLEKNKIANKHRLPKNDIISKPNKLNEKITATLETREEVVVDTETKIKLNTKTDANNIENHTIEKVTSVPNIYNTNFKEEEILLQKNTSKIYIKTDNHTNYKIALNGLSEIVQELNQSDENKDKHFKDLQAIADNTDMINKDYNIQEKDILPQMSPNMNFSGNGQPFSSFMEEKNADNKSKGNVLVSSASELAEEKAILSTMEENIAIANKNINSRERQIINEKGIKKVDTQTGITTEIIVKFDSVIMNKDDVEFFAKLVENGDADLNQLATQGAEKSAKISKTLINMLAKSIENNQPLRIDFDNNISVIIKISRDGKISADFLPSSQIAETYLKENLPLLRQRFDENNIEYETLNHRERKEQQKDKQQKERSQR